MPGKSHRPSLLERIIGDAKAGTTRRAGGLASNAASTTDRVRIAASRRGASSGLSPQAIKFKIDEFTITDDATDTFTLDFTPIPDSWRVWMGFPWAEDRYSISGKTLTVADPTDTFRSVAANGDRTLHVGYAYLAGVPAAPTEGTEFPLTATAGHQASPGTVSFASAPEAGASVLLVFNARNNDTSSAVSGLGATWAKLASVTGGTGSADTRPTELWLGTGCDGSGTTATVTAGGDMNGLQMVAVTPGLTATGVLTATAVSPTAVTGDITATGRGVAVVSSLSVSSNPFTDSPAGAWTNLPENTFATDSRVIAVTTGDTIHGGQSGMYHALAAFVPLA